MTRAGTAQQSDPVAEQAAEWIVRLTADDGAERERAHEGFEAWKRADPRHAAAAADMESFIARISLLRERAGGDARPARVALDAARGATVASERKPGRGKRIGAALAVAFALAVPARLAWDAWPPDWLLADVRSATGEWQTRSLADGSRLRLNGASAVNLRFDGRRRAVELVRGEILIDVAADAARAFVVETPHGSIRALGTRFVVRREDDATLLTMLESRAAVQAAGGDPTLVGAGQRVRITSAGVGAVEAIDPRSIEDAWTFRQLVVHDRPLAEVLEELNRHRPGRIHFDRAEIDAIRVSAVLPLADPDRALQLLLASFPQLRIRSVTPYLVLVDAPRGIR